LSGGWKVFEKGGVVVELLICEKVEMVRLFVDGGREKVGEGRSS